MVEGVWSPGYRILLRMTVEHHCIYYIRKTKNLDSRRQRKMYFVSVYFLSLNWEKKVLLMQSLRETVQYCTKCISMHLWPWTIIMTDTVIITFLKLFFFRCSYQMLLLHCHSCQITEKQQWILHLEYTKQIQMPKILGRKLT